MSPGSEQSYDFKIGTIVGIKGLKGEAKLKLLSDFDLVEPIDSVYLTQGDTTSKAKVRSLIMEGKSVLLRLEGYNSREDLEPMVGASIFTQKSQLRELEEDEWWFGDLVGLTAYTTGGVRVGTVSAIVDSGNYLLEIENEGKTFLVPFVKALVPKVDIKGKRLEIEALPGLLE
jgi:16S rRNA processing protein RimM